MRAQSREMAKQAEAEVLFTEPTTPQAAEPTSDAPDIQSLIAEAPKLDVRVARATEKAAEQRAALPNEQDEPVPSKRDEIYARRCWLGSAPGRLAAEARPLHEAIARWRADVAWRDVLAAGIRHFKGALDATDRREVYVRQRLKDAVEILEVGAVSVMPQELAEWFEERGHARWFDGRPGRRATVQRIAADEKQVRAASAELEARLRQVESMLSG